MFPLWNFFLTRRQFSYLLLVGLVIWGVSTAIIIRKESAPEVQVPVGIVTTILPGASAEEMEKLVTNKIEDRLANLSDVNKITSTSRESVSSVVVEYVASADIKESIDKLKDEVDKVKPDLPAEAEDPAVSDVNFVDQPIIIATVSTDLPFSALNALGEEVQSELQAIEGVSRVEIQGTREREIQVIVRKEDLSRFALTLGEVVNAIRLANASLPVGSIEVDGIRYGIRFEGDIENANDVARVPLRTPSGSTVYVRDIAIISDGVADATTLTRLSVGGAPSEQAFTINVFKSRGVDVTNVTGDVREKINEMRSPGGLLEGGEIAIVYDTGDLVERDLGELTETGIETVMLVVGLLFLTIGWRESMLAGLSVPLSFLLSFIGLYYSGNTINFVSLFSLILAIGILVDAGIVIMEAISVRMLRHADLSPKDAKLLAAQETIKEFSWPLIAGTATTIAVFVPLFFISGVVGKFIASIPFTIIAVLIASLIVALGVLPLLAVSFASTKRSRFNERQDRYADMARERYEQFLRKFFANRRLQRWFLRGLPILLLLTFLFPVFGLVKIEFFPGEDADFIFVNLELPEGTPLPETDLVMRGIEEVLYGMPYFTSMVTTIGASNQFSGGMDGQVGSGSRFANALLLLPPPGDRDDTSSRVVERVRAALASWNTGIVRVGEPSGGPPTGAPILVKFLGEDRDALERAAGEARRILAGIEGTTDIRVSGENDGIEFTLRADRAKLSELGLTPAEVASTLRTAVFGTEATSIETLTDTVDIVVRANLNTSTGDASKVTQATLDAVRQIPIGTRFGEVLLGSLVLPELRKASASISHEDRKRIVSVSANLKEGYNAAEATAAFTSEAHNAIDLSGDAGGVSMSVGGETEDVDQSFTEMFFAFIAGIILMYAIVVLEFNSLRLAAYTLLTVPLSLIGVFLGLAIMGKPLSFPSLIGVIALGGVIINHSIILIDSFVSPLRRHDSPELTFEDRVVKAAASRLRPIFLTTITTVVGMIPLSFASGLWAPLAFTIMFGLVFATVLTLVLIPVLLYRSPGKAIREQMESTNKATQSGLPMIRP